jgi:hypothetical protein
MLLLPPMPTVSMKFPFRTLHIIMLWFHVTMMLRVLPCVPAFLAFAPPQPLLVCDLVFALNLPFRLAGPADALSGVIYIGLLLLLLHPCRLAAVGLKLTRAGVNIPILQFYLPIPCSSHGLISSGYSNARYCLFLQNHISFIMTSYIVSDVSV